VSFRPLGLSLSKPLFAHRHPLGPRHRPLGLRYRSSVLLSRASCSLREAASGCAPDRAVPFLCFAKEKEPKERRPPSPVGPGPTALRCSVFAGRAELTTRPLAAAFRQPPEVRPRRRCAPLQSPALLDGSEGPQEQCGRLLRKHSLSHLASHRARGETNAPSRRCEAWCSSPPSDESAGVASLTTFLSTQAREQPANAGTRLRYLSLSGWRCAKADGGAKQAMTQRTQGAAPCPLS